LFASACAAMTAILRSALAVPVIFGLLAGCIGEPNEPGPDPGQDDGAADDGDGTGDTGDDGGDTADDGAPPPDPIAGQYEITTTFNVTEVTAVPGLVGSSLSILADLNEDPGGTLLDLLDQFNVPILDQLLALLPDVLLEPLVGFINDFLFDRLIAQIPAAEAFTTLVADLSELLTHFEVVSVLDVSEIDASDAVVATHRLSGVRFEWRGQDVLVDTPELLDEITVARDVTGSVSLGGGDGVLTLGEHAFHLPLGDFAIIGINLALQQTLGFANLRALLGALFDCPALAESVANRCLGPICVGHQAELEAVCESGLDLVAAQLEERLTTIDFTEIRFDSGDAVLRDAAEGNTRDGLIDLMEGGSWRSRVAVDGAVAVPLPSPFVGRRIPE
jgi:hypothetical protein